MRHEVVASHFHKMAHGQRAERVEGIGKQTRHRGLARAGIAEELELVVKLDRGTRSEALALFLQLERDLAYLLLYLVDTHIFVERLHHLVVCLGNILRAVDHVGTYRSAVGQHPDAFKVDVVGTSLGVVAARALCRVRIAAVVQIDAFQLLPALIGQGPSASLEQQPFRNEQHTLVADSGRL